MKSRDNKVRIYVRNKIIWLEANGKRITTKATNTEDNIEFYYKRGKREFDLLVEEKADVTFGSFAPKALEFINAQVTEATAIDIRSKYKNHLESYFKKKMINTITAREIELWQLKERKEKGANMAKRIKNLLARILDRAVVEELITVNPCNATSKVKISKKDRKLREVYTKEEIKKSSLIMRNLGLELF